MVLRVFKTPSLSILKKFAMAMASSLPQARDETAPFGFDQAKIFSQSRQCARRAISLLIFSNDAEKAVFFIDNSSSEINSLAERQKIP